MAVGEHGVVQVARLHGNLETGCEEATQRHQLRRVAGYGLRSEVVGA